MNVYAITHGDKVALIANPPLTEKGEMQISEAARKVPLSGIKTVIIATGTRFVSTYNVVRSLLREHERFFSPLIGSGDSDTLENDKPVLILQGGQTCEFNEYIGVNLSIRGFDPWEFIRGLQDSKKGDILLITGREFLGNEKMLGKNAESATVYQLKPSTEEVEKLS